MGANIIKGAKGINVTIIFQGLHMTFMCWFIISKTNSEPIYKCVLNSNILVHLDYT
jgi:hypothetical protein